MSQLPSDLACPSGLSPRGQKAWHVITCWLEASDLTYTGGCKAFYSPQEWKARGETYGRESELVVVYDGGDLAAVMSNELGYGLRESLSTELGAVAGVYFEDCTNWYAAIYPVE